MAAIYQAIHPGSVIEPLARTRPNYGYPTEDGVEDINTILYPFKHQDSQYWTSNDVSAAESTHKYGYAYPEIPSNLAGEELRSHAVTAVHALYGPNTDTPNFNETDGGALKRTEWLAHISFDESQIDGTFTVWVYIGDVAAGHEDSLSGKALVGGCASFSGGVTLTKRSIVAGTVPLTQAMANEGVKVSGRKADVVAYLRKNLKWKVMQVRFALTKHTAKTARLTSCIGNQRIAHIRASVARDRCLGFGRQVLYRRVKDARVRAVGDILRCNPRKGRSSQARARTPGRQ